MLMNSVLRGLGNSCHVHIYTYMHISSHRGSRPLGCALKMRASESVRLSREHVACLPAGG